MSEQHSEQFLSRFVFGVELFGWTLDVVNQIKNVVLRHWWVLTLDTKLVSVSCLNDKTLELIFFEFPTCIFCCFV